MHQPLPEDPGQAGPIAHGQTARPGRVVAWLTPESVPEFNCEGLASLEHGVTISATTVFNAGSLAKQFTAVLVGIAHARGLLGLEDPATRFLPRRLATALDGVRVRHVLHHTSGLSEYGPLFALRGIRQHDYISRADILSLVSRFGAPADVGRQFRYSNSNYVLLGLVLEQVFRAPLRAVAAEEVFEPLGMSRTMLLDSPNTVVPGRATSYRHDGFAFSVADSPTFAIGASELLTCAEDLLRWHRDKDATVLADPRVRAVCCTPGRLDNGTPLLYAGGTAVIEGPGPRVTYAHGGSIGGFESESTSTDDGFAVVCFSNLAGFPAARLARDVLDAAVAGRSPEDAVASCRHNEAPAAQGLPAPEAAPECTFGDRPTGRFVHHQLGAAMDLFLHEGDYVVRAAGVERVLIPRPDGTYVANGTAYGITGSHVVVSIPRVMPLRFERAEPLGQSRQLATPTSTLLAWSFDALLETNEASSLYATMQGVVKELPPEETVVGPRTRSVHRIDDLSASESAARYEPRGRVEYEFVPRALEDYLNEKVQARWGDMARLYPGATSLSPWTYVEYGPGQFVAAHTDYPHDESAPNSMKLAGISVVVHSDAEGGEFFVESIGSSEYWADAEGLDVRPGMHPGTAWFERLARTRWVADPAVGTAYLYGSRLVHGTQPVRTGSVAKFLSFVITSGGAG